MLLKTVNWSDMPRLNMRLTIAGETLTGEALDLPFPPSGTRKTPYVGYAKIWLEACARAQRLLEANGSSDLFREQPLRVSIGLRGTPSLPRTHAEQVSGEVICTAFKSARWLAQTLKSASHQSVISMHSWAASAEKLALNLGSSMPSPTMLMDTDSTKTSLTTTSTSDRKHIRVPVANFPTSGRVLHSIDGLGRQAPFWSAQSLAQYIVVHEFGHCAQTIHATSAGAYYGWNLMNTAMQNLFTHLGVLKAPSLQAAHEEGLRIHFGECYADVFAALALGGGSLESLRSWTQDIIAMRAASIPTVCSDYSHGDSAHDTRESLTELLSRVSTGSLPSSGQEVHDMCLRCAQAGSLRWTAAVATHNAGPISKLFWAHAATLTQKYEAKETFETHFESFITQARQSNMLSHIAQSLSLARAPARAAHGAGIFILLDIENLVGVPRVALTGTECSMPNGPSLWTKAGQARDAAVRPLRSIVNTLTSKVKLHHRFSG